MGKTKLATNFHRLYEIIAGSPTKTPEQSSGVKLAFQGPFLLRCFWRLIIPSLESNPSQVIVFCITPGAPLQQI